MKKILISFALSVIVLLAVGVFAAAAGEVEAVVDDVAENVAPKEGVPPEGGKVGEEVLDYVEEFVEKSGIKAEAINEVSEINFDDLPKEVNIENVDDTNLAIYQIDYDEGTEEKKVFVVTYSVEKLRAQGDLIIAHDKRQFLQFGFDGEMTKGFLETATGVEGSLEKGYVMMRPGSITAMSTNLEVVEGNGQIEIIIYKNGEQIGFGNSLSGDLGIKKDYDVQSNGVVTFEPGDVISVYADAPEGFVWKDVITMIEITTTN